MSPALDQSEANRVVDRILRAYREAWDAGDADTFGALFTEHASYVIFIGDALMGRDAVTNNHRDVFSTWQAGTKLRVHPIAIQVLGTDTISVLTAGGIGTSPEAIQLDKLQTFTLTRTTEGWQIAAFHNTSMSSRTKPLYDLTSAPGPEHR